MKTCPHCSSIAFDDMNVCFDCMGSLVEPGDKANEPVFGMSLSAARLQVTLADFFCYELLLHKLDGRSLSVGSASENAIVIPQEQVALHQLEVFYARGQIWAESVEASPQATIGEVLLLASRLEQITGTEIYSQLSVRTHENRNAEKAACRETVARQWVASPRWPGIAALRRASPAAQGGKQVTAWTV